MNAPKFLSSGDSAITVEFGNEISAEINACVHALDKALHKKNILGIVETVPTFRSLLIIYDPCITGGEKLKAKITKLCGDLEASSEDRKRIIEIPVLYGGKYGEDLKDVAEINKLTEDEVVKIHSGTDYLIYMLGFLPGFAYLGSKTSIPVSSFSSLFAVTSNGSSSTLSAGSISPAGTLSKNCPAGYRNSRFSRSLGSPLDGFQIVMQLTASGSIF